MSDVFKKEDWALFEKEEWALVAKLGSPIFHYLLKKTVGDFKVSAYAAATAAIQLVYYGAAGEQDRERFFGFLRQNLKHMDEHFDRRRDMQVKLTPVSNSSEAVH